MSTTFVLASGSPRRRQLLADLGGEFEVVSPDVDESVRRDEEPAAYVERISRLKAVTVRSRLGGDPPVVLAADTCVVDDAEILGKPADASAAREMLRRLSGRTHWTTTGVTVASAAGVTTTSVRTDVTFVKLLDSQIDWYVETGEPLDKAGAYGIQGIAGAFVERIEGSHSNVIGLPLAETVDLLAEHGVALTGRRP